MARDTPRVRGGDTGQRRFHARRGVQRTFFTLLFNPASNKHHECANANRTYLKLQLRRKSSRNMLSARSVSRIR